LLRQVLHGSPRDLAPVSRKPTFQLEAFQQHGKAHLASGRLLGKQGALLDRQRPVLAKLFGVLVPFHEGPQDAVLRGKSPASRPGVPWGELTHGTWLQRPGPWASIENHQGFIPNDGERYRNGERISTGFVESTVNHVVSQCFCEKPQIPWTKRAAHLLLQTRVKTLNHELNASRYN
jgi:hypothetical protein